MNAYLERIRDFALKIMAEEQANVYLFGSWARGNARHSSDVDIAVEGMAGDISAKIAAAACMQTDARRPITTEPSGSTKN